MWRRVDIMIRDFCFDHLKSSLCIIGIEENFVKRINIFLRNKLHYHFIEFRWREILSSSYLLDIEVAFSLAVFRT